MAFAHEADFTAAHAAAVFRIEDGERGEIRFPFVYAVGIVAQAGFHVVDFFLGDTRVDRDDFSLYLERNKWNGVFREGIEVFSYIRRRNLKVFRDVALHLLYAVLVAHRFGHLLAEFDHWLAEVFFYFLLRAEVCDQVVDTLVDGLIDHGFLHFDRVDVGLMEEELFKSETFGNHAVGVALYRSLLV